MIDWKPTNHTVAILSNIAFLISGIGLILKGFVAIGIFVALLLPLSGIHHYYLNSFTRKLDYIGMYGALIAVLTPIVELNFLYTVLTVAGLTAVLYVIFRVSRMLIGILSAVGLLIVFIQAGVETGLYVSSWLAVAYTFNYIGDHIHKEEKDYSLIHGLPWHVPAAYLLHLIPTVL